MHRAAELARPFALAAPRRYVVPVLVELHDAAVLIAVRDEEGAVRQRCDISRPPEVLRVGSGHALLAQGPDEFLSIACELENLLRLPIEEPDVTIAVVRIDPGGVRIAPEGEPL